MDYQNFIAPELLVLVPVLYGAGRVIKDSACPDKYIPAILTALSIGFTILYTFSANPIIGLQAIAQAIFTALTQGILIASASVYTNEMMKQLTKKDEK